MGHLEMMYINIQKDNDFPRFTQIDLTAGGSFDFQVGVGIWGERRFFMLSKVSAGVWDKVVRWEWVIGGTSVLHESVYSQHLAV